MSKKSSSAPTTAATAALSQAGIAFTAHVYPHDAAASDFGAEAVRELGVEPSRVFKTLLVASDAGFGVGIVPVDALLDLKALAAALGGKRAELADRAVAERKSGYVIGGISPIAQRTALPTVLDDSALGFETILVSGGRRGFDVELSPADLISVTGGMFSRIRR